LPASATSGFELEIAGQTHESRLTADEEIPQITRIAPNGGTDKICIYP
jgi:hypothetical protein